MTRQEHLEWCKERALELCRKGDVLNAFQSLSSDLRKHEETKDHCAIQLGMSLLIGGYLSTKEEMIDFINGFN